MTKTPEEVMVGIVQRYQRARADLRNERRGGRWMRRFEIEMDVQRERFDSMLHCWIAPDARQGWVEYLLGRRSDPPAASSPEPPPIFVGYTQAGARVAAWKLGDDKLRVLVDGVPTITGLCPEMEFGAAPWSVLRTVVHGQDLREAFESPGAGQAALANHHRGESAQPPLKWARALYEDGLIDVHFAITDRGQRLMRQQLAQRSLL